MSAEVALRLALCFGGSNKRGHWAPTNPTVKDEPNHPVPASTAIAIDTNVWGSRLNAGGYATEAIQSAGKLRCQLQDSAPC